eukprot:scaffold10979_cov124-Isochrysis_galbana.AAC.1
MDSVLVSVSAWAGWWLALTTRLPEPDWHGRARAGSQTFSPMELGCTVLPQGGDCDIYHV